jgi:hypothetical protein
VIHESPVTTREIASFIDRYLSGFLVHDNFNYAVLRSFQGVNQRLVLASEVLSFLNHFIGQSLSGPFWAPHKRPLQNVETTCLKPLKLQGNVFESLLVATSDSPSRKHQYCLMREAVKVESGPQNKVLSATPKRQLGYPFVDFSFDCAHRIVLPTYCKNLPPVTMKASPKGVKYARVVLGLDSRIFSYSGQLTAPQNCRVFVPVVQPHDCVQSLWLVDLTFFYSLPNRGYDFTCALRRDFHRVPMRNEEIPYDIFNAFSVISVRYFSVESRTCFNSLQKISNTSASC